MKDRIIQWGLLGSASLLSAFACSGRNLNDVGDLNTAGGAARSSLAGESSTAGAGLGGALGLGGARDDGGTRSVSGGIGGEEAGAGGEGGDHGPATPLPKDGSLVCATCQTVALARDIRGAACNDQKVFWIEYGSNDHFGNNNDGRLLARDLVGGPTATLADSLPGPEAVALSGTYVYMAADQGVGPDHFQVVRVPLAGGAAEIVHTPPTANLWSTWDVFAFGAGSEFWTWGGAVYRLDDTSTAPPETFIASGVAAISANVTALYYWGPFNSQMPSVWAKPLAGGEPVQLNAVSFGAQVQAGFLYGLDGNFLTRMPASGGAWRRVGRGFNYHLAIDGDAYFTDLPNYGASDAGVRRIMQESFSSFTTNVALAAEQVVDGDGANWKAFANSRVGVFFADARGLYLVPPAAP
jgi:hypothetical protein